ncbi:MAG: ABC transporter permease [Rhodobacteraceae bacterium]|nr:ABC transporter permease [Paracoccaceae bacterium]MBR9822997.1 ABC transporter permease [Paracoccaceae bacterium]
MSAGRRIALGLVAATLLALWLADLSAPRPDPWLTLARIGQGLLSPDLSDPASLAHAAMLTVAFAICGVALGAVAGLLLAPLYHLRAVRLPCIAIRALHELFWALLLMNLTGLSPLTGVLAIGLPYAGIFAKVFSEYLDEADARSAAALPPGTGRVTALIWQRYPQVLGQVASYMLYRLECGLRSSAVLGFIGLPTLGFQLETYFRQAQYDRAVVVLGVFFLLILPIRHWARWRLMPGYLLASLWALARIEVPPMGAGALGRFLGDITPAPIRTGAEWGPWLDKVLVQQGWPGVVDTLVLGQLALVLAGVLAALAFPLIVPRVAGRIGAQLGHALLVLFRSTPEYMLAFLLLQILGPSMLPAVLALALHNGAIIAHLLGRQAETLPLRADAPRGLTLWGWELLPRLQGNFRALCLYRWEIILRESAIMGVLGLGTLGFYVQKNLEELRLDRVAALLVVTVLLTLAVDSLSRALRRALLPQDRVRIEGGRGRA